MFDLPSNPYKRVEFAEARRLRHETGMPVRKIATRLGVSQGTVSRWVRDIEVLPAHKERNRLAHQGKRAVAKRNQRWSAMCREKRRNAQAEGQAAARQGDPTHLLGCMLYWAEGSKSRCSLIFANSDVAMCRAYVRFLRRCFDVPDAEVTIRVNAYTGNGLTEAEITEFWLRALELPETCLRKSIFNHFPTSSSGAKVNKLPYGVCTIRVLKSNLLMQHIFGAIQEYASFDEPMWLG